MFISPAKQIKNIKTWNEQYKWGFTPDDFKAIDSITKTIIMPYAELTTLVLVPYLATTQATVDALLKVIRDTHKKHYISDYLKDVTLAYGAHEPGLTWEVIDFDTNRRSAPANIGSDGAHAGVLAAACHFPEWVKSMDGREVPYVDLPCYRVTVPGESGPCAPFICGDSGGDVIVGVAPASYALPGYAEPVVFRESELGAGTLGTSEPLDLPKILEINGFKYERVEK